MTFTRFGLWLAIFAHKVEPGVQIDVTLISGTIEHAAANAKLILKQQGFEPNDFALVSLQASDGGVFGFTDENAEATPKGLDKEKAPDAKGAEGVLKFPKPN